ncbi:MAG: hypothetical protein R3C44_11485 [Chloroflexota bacterium]
MRSSGRRFCSPWANIGRPTPDALPVTLVWQAEAEPTADYLTFVHLVSAETGDIVSQADRVPVDGLRPTSGWRPGEVLVDHYVLPTTMICHRFI